MSVGTEDAATSVAINPVSTASADDIGTPAASPTDATEDLGAAPNDSGDGLAPFPNMEVGSGGGDEASTP
jgi:hypothetical protein